MVIPYDKVLQIVDTYGNNHQRYKAAEELSELMTLVLQDANDNGKVSRGRIIEEMADVYVMLKQLEVIYHLDSRDLEPVIDYKLDRTINEIGDENNEWR